MKNTTQRKKTSSKPKSEKDSIKVMIIHPVNRMKEKIGVPEGQNAAFTKEQIKRANDVCHEIREEGLDAMDAIISSLSRLWQTIKNSDKSQKATFHQKERSDMFLAYVNRLEDLAQQFSLNLITDFAFSLKNFMEIADTAKNEHQIIIQAHLDVITLAYRHKITDTYKTEATKLQKMLKRAIKENS